MRAPLEQLWAHGKKQRYVVFFCVLINSQWGVWTCTWKNMLELKPVQNPSQSASDRPQMKPTGQNLSHSTSTWRRLAICFSTVGLTTVTDKDRKLVQNAGNRPDTEPP